MNRERIAPIFRQLVLVDCCCNSSVHGARGAGSIPDLACPCGGLSGRHRLFHGAVAGQAAVRGVAIVCLSRPAWYSPVAWRPANLNQRIYAFVGKSVLSEPIVNGQGKLDIEGTRWDVLGPNLAKGATVKVTAVEGMKLRVTEA
jgi:hypothetical protein